MQTLSCKTACMSMHLFPRTLVQMVHRCKSAITYLQKPVTGPP